MAATVAAEHPRERRSELAREPVDYGALDLFDAGCSVHDEPLVVSS
jgi:hypothetical protein